MQWYLIWFFTVTLPDGNAFDTSEARALMPSEAVCHQTMELKQIEQEKQLGATRYIYSRLGGPAGGYGKITSVTVGCIQK